MKKIYESRVFWLIVSLLLALIMWVYVTSQSADEFKRTFPGVRVELVNEDILRNARNLVVTDLDTNSVTIEVVGPRRVVTALSAADIVAEVDVSKLTQAAYTSQQYNIRFPDGADTNSLQTTMMTPQTVNFNVSNQVSRPIPVRGSFDGSLADGYTAEPPTFDPSYITISGPEAYIKDVDCAWVSFGAENVSQTYTVETGFVLRDKNSEECSSSGISFSTDVIRASLPILMVKDVPLTVDIIEGAGASAANTKITIEPYDVITLVGDSALLAGKNRIVLATVDLTDFAVSYTDTYPILLDDDIINQTGISEAKVTVEVVGLETKTFTIRGANLSCINVTEGYTAEIISEGLEVTLRGTAEQLDKIKSENISAVADLRDFDNSVGSFMPEVKVYVDGFSDVGAIGSNKITVEIRKA